MINLKKFIQALDIIKPENRYSLGLIIMKSISQMNWAEVLVDVKYVNLKIESKEEKVDECLDKIAKALGQGKWLVLKLDKYIPSKVYAQLRLLSMSNRIQIVKNNEIIDVKQSATSRIIVVGKAEAVKEVEEEYPEFRNLFGPIIEV